jgi:hypothetical protein
MKPQMKKKNKGNDLTEDGSRFVLRSHRTIKTRIEKLGFVDYRLFKGERRCERDENENRERRSVSVAKILKRKRQREIGYSYSCSYSYRVNINIPSELHFPFLFVRILESPRNLFQAVPLFFFSRNFRDNSYFLLLETYKNH